MKKTLAVLGIAILVLVAVLLVRASALESRQVKAEPVTDLAVDANAAAQRLAGAVRFPTVSHEGGGTSRPRRSSASTSTSRRASPACTRR